MILSNKIRRDVAIGLAKKAVAKHGQGLAERFDTINKRFWDAHKANIEAVLPVPRSAWANLIQLGVVSGTIKVEPSIYYKPELSNQDIHKSMTLTLASITDDFDPMLFLGEIKEFAFIRKYFARTRYSRESYLMSLISDETVPQMNGYYKIHKDSELGKCINSARDDLLSVVKAFEKVYNDILGLLFSFKTDKQLLDHLPEAKEFLPLPEPKNSKAVVPAEYVKSLRERIAAGVPDKLGV